MSGIEIEKLRKDELFKYTKDLITQYTDLVNAYNALIVKNPEQILEIDKLNKEVIGLKEIIDQKDTIINNLIIENKNPKLNDINSLKKSSDTSVSVQFYKVMAYENRVNNSNEYGGREFEIATITVKYDNGTLSWDVDFKGSELFEPYKESFSNVLNEVQIEALTMHVFIHGWYKYLKSALQIPSEFNDESFFELFKNK